MDAFSGLNVECYNDLSAARRVLISEIAADDTYAEMLRATSNPTVTKVIQEIQADEQNHIGRLLSLITLLQGGETSSFQEQVSAGLADREVEG